MLDDVERVSDRVLLLADGRLRVDADMDDFLDRVTGYSIELDVVKPELLNSIPGLVEARHVGSRYQITVADSDQETMAALDRLGAQSIEQINPGFSESVLAYLARHRSGQSFFTAGA